MNADTAPLSVVVPTFYPGPHLGEALASLERQPLAPFEVVVVEDGSEPPVVLPSYQLPIQLLRFRHAGTAGARNSGVRATTAPLGHICDHGDLIEPTFFEQMAVLFASNTIIEVAHSVCEYIGLPLPLLFNE